MLGRKRVNEALALMGEMFPNAHGELEWETPFQLTARDVLMNFDGQVPKTHKELESLPGVGRKTANVVLAEVYGIPSIAVDTHVSRVSKRLNIVAEDASVEEIEAELMKKIPKRDWIISHHRMIFFGRYHCLAKNPKCQTCPLQSYCKYYKETTKK